MSDPITFPITVYWIHGDKILQRTFSKNEARFATYKLRGTQFEIYTGGGFDAHNESEYYCTDLEMVKAELIEKFRKEFVIKMMEFCGKIKSVEEYKCKNQ